MTKCRDCKNFIDSKIFTDSGWIFIVNNQELGWGDDEWATEERTGVTLAYDPNKAIYKTDCFYFTPK